MGVDSVTVKGVGNETGLPDVVTHRPLMIVALVIEYAVNTMEEIVVETL